MTTLLQDIIAETEGTPRTDLDALLDSTNKQAQVDRIIADFAEKTGLSLDAARVRLAEIAKARLEVRS